MQQTYKAVLRGNQLEWHGDAPRQVEGEQAVEVHVTILEEPAAQDANRGKSMAEALEKLAAANTLTDIADPAAWEREQRQDRPLPGRDA
ncbi:MAG: hypothetical protein M3Q76_13480 [Acidobacteriota bacterium]|nr:hypothetical protein [Acidobacteriota bacterium]